MSIRTRIDGRSPKNNSLQVVDSDGNVAAVITVVSLKAVELSVQTASHLSIEKVNGYKSRDKE